MVRAVEAMAWARGSCWLSLDPTWQRVLPTVRFILNTKAQLAFQDDTSFEKSTFSIIEVRAILENGLVLKYEWLANMMLGRGSLYSHWLIYLNIIMTNIRIAYHNPSSLASGSGSLLLSSGVVDLGLFSKIPQTSSCTNTGHWLETNKCPTSGCQTSTSSP